ncbi:MAG: flavodoxin family protein [Acetobacterium woodii]|nr:flavodoxin family protein [Acetobacterium woodii]
MKTMIVREYHDFFLPDSYILDLSDQKIKGCTGCWTCWWKTPGRCIHHDLDFFYHHYITSEKVSFYLTVSQGFVSGNLKTLFDRMIPLFLPYTNYASGESMHDKRYDRYPDIEIHYYDTFLDAAEKKIFEDYLQRTFYQFHSKNISLIGEMRDVRP